MNYLEIQKQKKTLKIKIKKWKKGKNNIIAKRAIILFFLFIILIFVFLGYLIHTSKIGIEIDNFMFDTEKQEKLNKDSKIYVYLLLLNKIKVFKTNILKDGNSKIKLEKKDLDLIFFKNKDFRIDYLELQKNRNIDIKEIDLQLQIGTQDAGLTAILTGIISALLGIILRKPKYEVIPIYSNNNVLKIKLKCIISIYLMQYIYSFIFKKEKFLKQRGGIIHE